MKNLTEKNFKILIRVSSGVLLGVVLIMLSNISPLALPLAGIGLIFAIGDKYFAKELAWLEKTMKEKANLTFVEDASEEAVSEAPKKAARKAKKENAE